MTGNGLKRMFLGGLATSFLNVVLGLACGAVLGSILDRTYGVVASNGLSALTLVATLPIYLIVTGGPVWGALLGLISGRLKSRRNIIGVAVLFGLAQAAITSAQLYASDVAFLAIYAALAIISIAAGGLSTADVT